MALSTLELWSALDSVISIPIIPFKDKKIDYEGHAKNIAYLMNNNHLDGGRKRVIALAGTSLIHHISAADQIRLMELTGQQMGGEGVLMSGIVPNPIGDAGKIIEAQANLPYPPDVYLLMPLSGVNNAAGLYQQYMEFGEHYGTEANARFLYYLRQKSERDVAVRLINDSPHFIGMKVGTDEDDVSPAVAAVSEDCGMVIWGIGDRSTRAAELGARGHTSGINVVVVRAADAINNAQRCGDYEASRQVENEIAPLEEIRFRDGRMYNYSAVVEAMHLGGFDDVEGGSGGPFNPRVPPEVVREVEAVMENIKHYH
jgi:dihydrodipicolinate synthase/N-acetylneuraminate lyase